MKYLVLTCFILTACATEDGGQKAMEVALDPTVVLPASEGPGEPATEPEALPPPPTPVEPTAAPTGPPDGITEQTIQTLDCASGGTVRVTIRRELSDDAYKRKGSLRWEYTDCGAWPYGVINGTASYSRSIEGGPPWKRELRYFADLAYTAGEECDAYVTLTQTWATADHPLELPSTCPHPVREWWDRLGIGPG